MSAEALRWRAARRDLESVSAAARRCAEEARRLLDSVSLEYAPEASAASDIHRRALLVIAGIDVLARLLDKRERGLQPESEVKK
jgi:hypothetical protein